MPQDAQKIRSVAAFPWLTIPTLFVVIAVLAFNFVGDGLCDAGDPYNDPSLELGGHQALQDA